MNSKTVAAGLRRAVEDAGREPGALGAGLPVQSEAVRRCRDDLLELAERLESNRDRGWLALTLASELLSDLDSPLYQGSGDLAHAVRRALHACPPAA